MANDASSQVIPPLDWIEIRKFEDNIKKLEGRKVLDEYYRYIIWMEKNFPSRKKEREKIIRRCTQQFDTNEYNQDDKLVAIWLKSEFFKDIDRLYKQMKQKNIGVTSSLFYTTWAKYYEKKGDIEKVEELLATGKSIKSKPYAKLEKFAKEFQARRKAQRDDFKAENDGGNMPEKPTEREDMKENEGTTHNCQTTSSSKTSNAEEIEFEEKIKTLEGKELIKEFYRYITWMEEKHPTREMEIKNLIKRFLKRFKDNTQYNQDSRLFTIWMKTTRFQKPEAAYKLMCEGDIGSSLAAFYTSWARYFEKVGNYKKVEEILALGKNRNAQPCKKIERFLREYKVRLKKRKPIAGSDHNEESKTNFVISDEKVSTDITKEHEGGENASNITEEDIEMKKAALEGKMVPPKSENWVNGEKEQYITEKSKGNKVTNNDKVSSEICDTSLKYTPSCIQNNLSTIAESKCQEGKNVITNPGKVSSEDLYLKNRLDDTENCSHDARISEHENVEPLIVNRHTICENIDRISENKCHYQEDNLPHIPARKQDKLEEVLFDGNKKSFTQNDVTRLKEKEVDERNGGNSKCYVSKIESENMDNIGKDSEMELCESSAAVMEIDVKVKEDQDDNRGSNDGRISANYSVSDERTVAPKEIVDSRGRRSSLSNSSYEKDEAMVPHNSKVLSENADFIMEDNATSKGTSCRVAESKIEKCESITVNKENLRDDKYLIGENKPKYCERDEHPVTELNDQKSKNRDSVVTRLNSNSSNTVEGVCVDETKVAKGNSFQKRDKEIPVSAPGRSTVLSNDLSIMEIMDVFDKTIPHDSEPFLSLHDLMFGVGVSPKPLKHSVPVECFDRSEQSPVQSNIHAKAADEPPSEDEDIKPSKQSVEEEMLENSSTNVINVGNSSFNSDSVKPPEEDAGVKLSQKMIDDEMLKAPTDLIEADPSFECDFVKRPTTDKGVKLSEQVIDDEMLKAPTDIIEPDPSFECNSVQPPTADKGVKLSEQVIDDEMLKAPSDIIEPDSSFECNFVQRPTADKGIKLSEQVIDDKMLKAPTDLIEPVPSFECNSVKRSTADKRIKLSEQVIDDEMLKAPTDLIEPVPSFEYNFVKRSTTDKRIKLSEQVTDDEMLKVPTDLIEPIPSFECNFVKRSTTDDELLQGRKRKGMLQDTLGGSRESKSSFSACSTSIKNIISDEPLKNLFNDAMEADTSFENVFAKHSAKGKSNSIASASRVFPENTLNQDIKCPNSKKSIILSAPESAAIPLDMRKMKGKSNENSVSTHDFNFDAIGLSACQSTVIMPSLKKSSDCFRKVDGSSNKEQSKLVIDDKMLGSIGFSLSDSTNRNNLEFPDVCQSTSSLSIKNLPENHSLLTNSPTMFRKDAVQKVKSLFNDTDVHDTTSQDNLFEEMFQKKSSSKGFAVFEDNNESKVDSHNSRHLMQKDVNHKNNGIDKIALKTCGDTDRKGFKIFEDDESGNKRSDIDSEADMKHHPIHEKNKGSLFLENKILNDGHSENQVSTVRERCTNHKNINCFIKENEAVNSNFPIPVDSSIDIIGPPNYQSTTIIQPIKKSANTTSKINLISNNEDCNFLMHHDDLSSIELPQVGSARKNEEKYSGTCPSASSLMNKNNHDNVATDEKAILKKTEMALTDYSIAANSPTILRKDAFRKVKSLFNDTDIPDATSQINSFEEKLLKKSSPKGFVIFEDGDESQVSLQCSDSQAQNAKKKGFKIFEDKIDQSDKVFKEVGDDDNQIALKLQAVPTDRKGFEIFVDNEEYQCKRSCPPCDRDSESIHTGEESTQRSALENKENLVASCGRNDVKKRARMISSSDDELTQEELKKKIVRLASSDVPIEDSNAVYRPQLSGFQFQFNPEQNEQKWVSEPTDLSMIIEYSNESSGSRKRGSSGSSLSRTNDIESDTNNSLNLITIDEMQMLSYLNIVSPTIVSSENFTEIRKPLPTLQGANLELDIGSRSVHIRRSMKNNHFAMYKAINQEQEDVVIKCIDKDFEKYLWDFYISNEIHKRLDLFGKEDFLPYQDRSMHSNFLKYKYVCKFTDCVYMETQLYVKGTLMDTIQLYSKYNCTMDEALVMFYAYEILNIIRTLHKMNIIHGNLKPDYFLEINSNINKEVGPLGFHKIVLNHFHRSIDLSLISNHSGTMFVGNNHSKSFECNEMKEGKPWKYEVDYYAAAATIYAIAFKGAMRTHLCQQSNLLVASYSLPRGWNNDLWSQLFSTLINSSANAESIKGLIEKLAFELLKPKSRDELNEAILKTSDLCMNDL